MWDRTPEYNEIGKGLKVGIGDTPLSIAYKNSNDTLLETLIDTERSYLTEKYMEEHKSKTDNVEDEVNKKISEIMMEAARRVEIGEIREKREENRRYKPPIESRHLEEWLASWIRSR